MTDYASENVSDDMTDDVLKLTSYFGERLRNDRRFVAEGLLDLYGGAGVATSILLRGVEGFGLRHHLRTDHSLSLSEDLPVVAVAVDNPDRILQVAERTAELVQPGLVTLERAHLYRPGSREPRLGAGNPGPDEPPGTTQPVGDEQKLTVYLGRRERARGVPAFVAVCELLREHGVGGGLALLGVDGTAHGRRERARFFHGNDDVPMMVIAVGGTAAITRALAAVTDVLADPFVTLERVEVCKRDGRLLRRPTPAPEPEPGGLVMWQKLMVHASEAALHEGVPIHRALTRRLRAAGASGSTTLRGVWGFHGEHPPHGDRLLQLGRRAPTVTVVVEHPDRVSAAFEVIDELTSERGLVTSELVPGLRSTSADHGRGTLNPR